MEREKREEKGSLHEMRKEKKETEDDENERGDAEEASKRPEILWIIVPYRDRENQLKEWLPRVCEFLQALTSSSQPGVHTPQQHVKTEAFIAIAEQDDHFLFNKGIENRFSLQENSSTSTSFPHWHYLLYQKHTPRKQPSLSLFLSPWSQTSIHGASSTYLSMYI